jgi:hypothetical protein
MPEPDISTWGKSGHLYLGPIIKLARPCQIYYAMLAYSGYTVSPGALFLAAALGTSTQFRGVSPEGHSRRNHGGLE